MRSPLREVWQTSRRRRRVHIKYRMYVILRRRGANEGSEVENRT